MEISHRSWDCFFSDIHLYEFMVEMYFLNEVFFASLLIVYFYNVRLLVSLLAMSVFSIVWGPWGILGLLQTVT